MRRSFSFLFGGILVLFGVVILLDNLGYVDSGWVFDNLWPILLILAGIALLGRRSGWREYRYRQSRVGSSDSTGTTGQPTSGDHISESEVFGSIRRQISSKSFTGGNCSVVFGDIKLDLTRVELSPGEQALRFSSVFGNVRVELPEGMEYSVRANFVAGGLNIKGERHGGIFQNVAVRSSGFTAAEQRLAILASSVFGEIRII